MFYVSHMQTIETTLGSSQREWEVYSLAPQMLLRIVTRCYLIVNPAENDYKPVFNCCRSVSLSPVFEPVAHLSGCEICGPC